MADQEVDHDRADIRFELQADHPPLHLIAVHEDKLIDLAILRAGHHPRWQFEVVDVQDFGMMKVRPDVPVGEGDDAHAADVLGDQVLGQGRLLGGLGEDAVQRGVVCLYTAGDGAIQQAGIGEHAGAPSGDPDLGRAPRCAHVAREVGAARGDAEERGGEAFDLDKGPGAHDAEVLAVHAAERREDGVVDGGVHGLLEGGVGVDGERRVWRAGREGDATVVMVDDERGGPRHARDGVWVDVAVSSGVGRYVKAVVWRAICFKVDRDAGGFVGQGSASNESSVGNVACSRETWRHSLVDNGDEI